MRKIKVVLALTLLLGFFLTHAQHEKMDQIMEDAFQERDNNVFTIRFFDALSGDPVQGAEVVFESIGTFASDSAGRVIFPKQPEGLLKAIFKKHGYISAQVSIDVAAETILRNRYYVSPAMSIDQFRVVLGWDQQPDDLDAHLLKTNSYHISFRNTRVLNDGSGQLDRDDMDGYGPETITVSQLNPNSEYTFSVKNYSAEKNPSAPSLTNSKATVWVYGNSKLLDVFYIPSNVTGNTWHVFKVVQGQVVPL